MVERATGVAAEVETAPALLKADTVVEVQAIAKADVEDVEDAVLQEELEVEREDVDVDEASRANHHRQPHPTQPLLPATLNILIDNIPLLSPKVRILVHLLNGHILELETSIAVRVSAYYHRYQ